MCQDVKPNVKRQTRFKEHICNINSWHVYYVREKKTTNCNHHKLFIINKKLITI